MVHPLPFRYRPGKDVLSMRRGKMGGSGSATPRHAKGNRPDPLHTLRSDALSGIANSASHPATALPIVGRPFPAPILQGIR